MPHTRPDPRLMSDTELAVWLRATAKVLAWRRFDWHRHARPEQVEPRRYRVWLILAGRGWGKSRTGAETIRARAAARPAGHFAVVAKTHREVLNICFEAPGAGLVNVIPPDEVAEFKRGAGSVALTLSNGSVLRAFSAEDPDTLRGYAFDGVWLDEFAAYPPKTAQAVYDMAWFCMRESADPRMVVTTTPKPSPHVKKLLARAAHDRRVVVTRGRTLDNRANLSGPALEELLDQYAGTRLGRQELDAELLEDVEGALWQAGWIEAGRVDVAPELLRVVVAVDPAETVSETSDETGIVVAGRGADGDDYVLADRSAKVAGRAAARRVWQAYSDFHANTVIVEGSSLWMLDILTDVWQEMQDVGHLPAGDPPIDRRAAKANASKKVRAEPVAARYERQPPRVHHVGALPRLEEQQTTWTPEAGDSPDRLDALVHAIAYLRSKDTRRALIASPATGASSWLRADRGLGADRGRRR